MKIKRILILGLLTFLLITNFIPIVNARSVKSLNSISKSSKNINSSPTLLNQGKQFYDEGNFAAAAEVWEKAVNNYSLNKEKRNLALAYRYLAIVYQDLGKWKAANKAISQSLKLAENINDRFLYAQILNTQARYQLNTGNTQAALETWKQAESIYKSLKDNQGIILTQINQAQALQNLGFYRRSRDILEQVNQNIQTVSDLSLKAKSLLSLGVALEVVGDLEKSQNVLSESLIIAQDINSSQIGETYLRLGNTARAREDFEQAENYYQQAIDNSQSSLLKLQAQINQLSLLIKTEQTKKAFTLIPEIKYLFVKLPPSRTKIYAQVNFVNNLINLENNIKTKVPNISNQELAKILATSVTEAKQLKDFKAQSYALGELGYLYEQNKQSSEALQLTNQALTIAQDLQATETIPMLRWQQGRILKARGDKNQAINAYSEAIKGIESLRRDLVAVNSENSDMQFSFRKRVEPVYRQLVELLVQDIDKLPQATKQQYLEKSRLTIEGLQQRELENFFRAACLTARKQNIDNIDTEAAVIYPIILDNSLETIISLPGKPLKHYSTKLDSQERIKVFQEVRQYLNPVFKSTDVLPSAQKIYDLLIRPAEKDLQQQNIKTLVFVLDGRLRSLPMGVLHDGEKYLIEKYNIALTPGLQLLPVSPISFAKRNTLTAGLAVSRQGFSALPGVEREIKQINQIVPSKTLLNERFSKDIIGKQIKNIPFSVIHFATHGQFSSKAKDTFVLTWDDKIQVNDFNQLLQRNNDKEAIELLVLSACKTAKGDERAILGLAGIAVRSGARSTIATLWSVRDKSTSEMMTQFYRNLAQTNVSKAQALRQAQLSLLKNPKYKHPYYWSPFILVGNWQ
ncbi:TPR repeat protein [Calothrix parasitica NIES-267]|uniref:TPR repeat protein n=1 Tax=Calothrix parasitica NIES-267 TaxID=1973488 RepID=A0A1Z4LSV5_9CYAN|nr:TPR repeat protein [Calothrix parasitica NIES-267]